MTCYWCQHEMTDDLACDTDTYAIGGRTFERIASVQEEPESF
jgi:hypothetical protein